MPATDIVAVKRAAEARLLATPGVSAVGIGPKFVRGQRTGELAIQVFVVHKRAVDEVPSGELVPPQIEGFLTDVVEMGPVQQLDLTIAEGPAASNKDTAEYDVLRGGIQLDGNAGGVGTLGCIGYALADNRQVLVTNQHVLYTGRDVNPGCANSVGQPTSQSCCECMDFCGRIVAHKRRPAVLSATLDGAIAELVPGTKWRPEIQDKPNPIAIRDIHNVIPDEITATYHVYKRGRTTLKTTGWIYSVDRSGIVQDHDGNKHRDYQHSVLVVADSASFVQGGDSGSALVNANDEIVGLIFAEGSIKINDTTHNTGVASAIARVTSELDIRIATSANTPSGDQIVPPMPRFPKGDFPLPRETLATVAAPPGSDELVRAPGGEFWLRLAATPLGQEFTNAALRHRDEILALACTCARVIAAWRHYGGPQIVRLLQEGAIDGPALPEAVKGRPFPEALQRFANIVLSYASVELAADVRRCAPRIAALGGKPYPELLEACGEPLAADAP